MDQGIDANSLTTKDTVLTLTVSQGPNKAVSEAQDEVTTLTPVISLPSSEPKEEKTTAPQHGQAVRENNETVKPCLLYTSKLNNEEQQKYNSHTG